jgi:hypothetical protein
MNDFLTVAIGISILLIPVLIAIKYTEGMFSSPKQSIMATLMLVIVLAITTLIVWWIMNIFGL